MIIANTLVLAMDHYPEDETFVNQTEVVNFILNLIFAFEMILKLVGLGIVKYCKDSFNIYDAIIVIVSVATAALSPPTLLVGSSATSRGGSKV